MEFALPFSYATQEPHDLLPPSFRFLGVRIKEGFGPLKEGEEYYGIEITQDEVMVFDASGKTIMNFAAKITLQVEPLLMARFMERK